MKPAAGLDGLLLVDKPSGPTSHDLVRDVRRCLGVARVGHAGTLDPLASGLLPLVIGRATRLVRFLDDSPKVYGGTLELGLRTDTDDVTGEVLERHDGDLPEAPRVCEAARALVGRQLQVPPAFSARKVEGRRMYRLARRGIPVNGSPAPVEVFRFELTPTARGSIFAFIAEVTPGTYVRGLIRDLGRHLGCGGVLATLRRLRIGPLSVEQAVPGGPVLDAAELRRALQPLERMPLSPPPMHLELPEEAARFVAGGALRVEAPAGGQRVVRVLDPQGSLLGIGELEQGELRPRVVLGSIARSPGVW
jgi:tRNA pseudouridine55 synthase